MSFLLASRGELYSHGTVGGIFCNFHLRYTGNSVASEVWPWRHKFEEIESDKSRRKLSSAVHRTRDLNPTLFPIIRHQPCEPAEGGAGEIQKAIYYAYSLAAKLKLLNLVWRRYLE